MSDRATRDWEHYSENVEAILTDLIAELRHRHAPYRVCMECDDWYAGCEDHEHITVCLWCCTSHGYHSMDCADNHTGTTLAEHCVTVGMADRAEARMKGLVNPVTPECGGAVPGDDCEGSITIWHENFRSTQWLCVKHYNEWKAARDRKRANWPTALNND